MDNNQMQGQGSGGPQRPDGQRQPDQNGRNKNNGKKPNSGKSILVFLVITLVVMLISNMFTSMVKDTTEREITYNQFINMVDRGEVESVEISSSRIDINLKNQPIPGVKITCYTGIMDDPDLTDRLLQAGVQCTKKVPDNSSYLILNIVANILPLVMIGFIFYFFMRRMGSGGGVMGVGKSKAKVYGEKETGVTFQDVAGQDEAKESLQEVVGFLEDPQKYVKIGAKLPKGALLVGPPGTGKTLLAKAVAGEAGVPFFSISGSDFVEMFVGVGASRVRDLFETAKKNAPSIIFIDEIDAVGRQRGAGLGGGHDEREQTLNQLLVEMDGFEGNEGVIVIAATNRRDILDPALLRPGRFDREVMVGYPDVKGREEILKVHAKNKPLAPDVDLNVIAKTTQQFTGADLENLLNEAALLAARNDRKAITEADIEEATVKVVSGPEKRSHIVTDRDRRITAYHEAGHAVAAYNLPLADKVHMVTIIPRGDAGGFTMARPTTDDQFKTKNQLIQQIVWAMGGRVAESIVFDDITWGASGDIQSATRIAKTMITRCGFSEKLGPIQYGSSDEVFLGRDFGHTQDYSESTAALIDDEVKNIVESAYADCEKILKEHRHQLDELADYLLEYEKIDGESFDKLMKDQLDWRKDIKKAEPAAEPVKETETEAPAETDSPAEADENKTEE